MYDRITKKTAFYAGGGAIGGALGEIISELFAFNEATDSFIECLVHTAIWMGVIGFGVSISLLVALGIYLRKTPNWQSLVKAALIGAGAGAVAGGLAQFIYSFALAEIGKFGLLPRVIQALCWGLAGLGLGLGVSLFTPNYSALKAILAGFAGGAIGGAIFLLSGAFLPETISRIAGIAILGATIGLTISAVEEILREAWLTIIWGKNETSSVSLGQKPVTLGSSSEADIRLPRKKYPPVTAVISVENGKVILDNRLSNQRVALPNGSKISMGTIGVIINIRKSGIDRKER
ncbi:MAG: FHA domain-containing protein [Helicobacteraceae bacterium]|jgi:hypothetical protein|nr:FHA domain-containing protein [Helicobacteraceae bacterium]